MSAHLENLRLSQFEPFAALGRSEIDLVARHARRLLIPEDRWLLRPGRALRGHHFLLHGSVATVQPEAVITAGQPTAQRALYPGAAGLRTITACEFLQVPNTVFELLTPSAAEPLIVVGEADDCWQRRFLGSELMSTLPAPVWQRLLSCLKPLHIARGSWVIRQDEQSAGSCFVLAAGAARVVRSGTLLARLQPGDLFGEDALITGEPRNASVQMETDGQVMALSALHFRDFLVSSLLEGVYAEPPTSGRTEPRELIRFGSSRDLRDRIARLSAAQAYLVSSHRPEVESLALFLMRKHGLKAWAAPGQPIRP
jgi:CRP-like cAMP-binding protein